MNTNKLDKYIDLIVRSGLNVIEGDVVTIYADIKIADFVHKISKVIYQYGAREVKVKYSDEQLLKQRCEYVDNKILENIPDSERKFYEEEIETKSKRLSLISPNLDLLKNIDACKLMIIDKALKSMTLEYRQCIMSDKINWTLAGVANKEWAKKVFKNCDVEVAVDKLWDAIFQTVYIDEENDSSSMWKIKQDKLKNIADKLNKMNLLELSYTNSLGTNLCVGLPKGHLWSSAGSTNILTGQYFYANMPTEEVYTLPDCNKVNGVVYSSKPLVFGGKIIDKFNLHFKNGKVVEFDAEIGKDVLEEILNTDEGSRRLGEVALVPYNSAVGLTNILFYNTLFDENASCHFALGQAYESNFPNINKYEKETRREKGYNESANHVDFMIGTRDLSIIGKLADGNEIVIFSNGLFNEEIFN